MRKRTILLVLFTILLLSSISFADDNYEILSYTVNAKISEDAVFNIEEIISVNFKNNIHNFYRDIPIHYNGYDHKISDIKVVDPITNKKIEFDLERYSNKVRVIINSKDNTDYSDVNYKILYTFNYGDDLDRSIDFIHYNFIGSNWNSSIPISKINIEMPKSFNKNNIVFTTGRDDITNVGYFVYGNKIEANVNYLYPYEGVTFDLKLQKNYFSNVTSPYSRVKLLLLFAVIVGIIIGATYLRYTGRNANSIVPILSYGPPNELNPAELAYLYTDGELTSDAVVNIVLYWASKGYLTIIDQNGVMTYENRISYESISNDAERELYEAMFSHGDGSLVKENQLKDVFYEDVNKYISTTKVKYTTENDAMIDSYQYYPFIGMILLSVIVSLFVCFDISLQFGIGKIISFVGVLALLIISEVLVHSIFTRVSVKGLKKASVVITMLLLIFVPVVLLYNLVTANGLGNILHLEDFKFSLHDGLTLWSVLIVSIYVFTVFAAWSVLRINKISGFAYKRLNKIHGFKEFLEKAKLDEIKSIYYDNNSYYYDMLPYVLTFDLIEIWSKHEDNLSLENPDWYKSPIDRDFNAYNFSNDFIQSMKNATSVPEVVYEDGETSI